MRTRKAHYFEEDDLAAIQIIRVRYGCASDDAAIRLALRLVADPEAIRVTLAPKKVKQATKRP